MNLSFPSLLGILFAISELVISFRRRAEGSDRDKGSLALIWVVIVVCVVFAYNATYSFPAGDLGSLAEPARALGYVLFFAGIALRWYAIIYLGRFFTVNVAIAHDHELIDGGPYRHVRHPSYTGALLAFLGLGLAMANWLSIFLMVVPTFLVFRRRMNVEETALLSGLGEPYRAYMRRTYRLLPKIY
jgi:protein-S-isoprenylcysteine O-methyltransferase